jgi:hypothetical protein
VTGERSNGHFDPAEDGTDLADDAPLDAGEEAAAALEASAETDESLDERVEAVIEDIGGVERVREGESVRYLVGGRAFAVLLPDVLEVALDPVVAKAALKTADTLASSRGAGWVAFTPEAIDRFALDRAEAWIRSAHRRAAAPG